MARTSKTGRPGGASPWAPSIDPLEVERFERLAELWWQPEGPFWPLHRLNRLRVDYLREALARHFGCSTEAARPLAGLRLLDIGCGGGLLSEAMAELGAEVLGIDVIARNIACAERHAADRALPLRYARVSAEDLAARGTTFDVVLNMEVVEHVADLDSFLAACCALVRPGGALVIATINRTLRSFLMAIVGAEYLLGWLPRGTHRWHKFPRPAELELLLARGGLTVAAQTGVAVAPRSRRFRLCRSLAVNYLLFAIRPAEGVADAAIGL